MTTRSIEEVYRAHGHVVLRRARQILGSDDEARDVLHDIFLDLAQRPDDLAAVNTMTAWLYTRTTFECMSRIRRRHRRDGLLAARGAEPETGAFDELVALRDLFARLPDDLAAVAVYHHLDGMTHAEIAELLGCSRRHVGDLIARIAEWAARERRTA